MEFLFRRFAFCPASRAGSLWSGGKNAARFVCPELYLHTVVRGLRGSAVGGLPPSSRRALTPFARGAGGFCSRLGGGRGKNRHYSKANPPSLPSPHRGEHQLPIVCANRPPTLLFKSFSPPSASPRWGDITVRFGSRQSYSDNGVLLSLVFGNDNSKEILVSSILCNSSINTLSHFLGHWYTIFWPVYRSWYRATDNRSFSHYKALFD